MRQQRFALTAALLLHYVGTIAAQAPGAAPSQDSALSLSMTFTAFMVMLGPVKIVGPFAAHTAGMNQSELRNTAFRAIGFASAGGLAAAVVGQYALASWGIPPAVLHLTAGLILLLVALKSVLAQYEPPPEGPTTTVAPRRLALMPLAFPTILTPHGIAIFILLLAVTHDSSRDAVIIGLFAVVMILNLLAMWFARPIVRLGGAVLAILGAVLGVLQVALALRMMLEAIRILGLTSAPPG